ncbi:hypothetical protein H5410_018317 [Solanum commersonii]|uniref:O-fucosyltransferase family protein n=1 Tax=Solanum commersonii TaxID=4109 RepID=A0A9J6A1N6_SOLCO|nr:hypothetical protein H5410_018317 [Solanum commersonii]
MQILPLFSKHQVIHFNRTDTRLANNGIPLELQKLRCRVNFQALKFTPDIEALGEKLVRRYITLCTGYIRFDTFHIVGYIALCTGYIRFDTFHIVGYIALCTGYIALCTGYIAFDTFHIAGYIALCTGYIGNLD